LTEYPFSDTRAARLPSRPQPQIDAFGEKTAVLIGHDWGSAIAWQSLLLHPKRYTALVAMSVPYGGRPETSPRATLKKTHGDNFYYTLYFQEPGAAEKELDADPRGFLSRLYLSPDSPSLQRRKCVRVEEHRHSSVERGTVFRGIGPGLLRVPSNTVQYIRNVAWVGVHRGWSRTGSPTSAAHPERPDSRGRQLFFVSPRPVLPDRPLL
jgi:pimeloyl-ACP methyl ester carboxylesterase